ncbi:hypothetical protein FA95DRAFT_1676753 [Auriscalpium vulgare]|uniref:Uncharacterized protein n=1 Tax=Auriscalpium vulgare TaxID=40419 RepID=A0ACB8S248_9AGAM|nr:hypothetical protein FA95DRAFT_1676753 [Auriscalpium vulgare]
MAIDLHIRIQSDARTSRWSAIRLPLLARKRRCLDKSSPIARLPVELLSEILSYLPLFAPAELDAQAPENISSGLAIAHVCRRWRAIVHATRRLWTVIPLRHPDLATLALRLSHPAPVELHVDLSLVLRSPQYLETVCNALQHVPRTQVLSMGFHSQRYEQDPEDPGNIVTQLIDILRMRPAPLLQAFSFSDTANCENPLPVDLFNRAPVPNLRSLKLINGVVARGSNLFQAPLTELELQNCATYWVDEKEQVMHFGDTSDHLHILKGLATLQSLAIRGLWNDKRNPVDHAQLEARSIGLPMLERLELQDGIDTVSSFLTYLCIAPKANLDITIDDNSRTITEHASLDFSRLANPLAAHFRRAVAAELFYDEVRVTMSHGSEADVVSYEGRNPHELPAVDRSTAHPEEDASLPPYMRFSLRTHAPPQRLLSILPMFHATRNLSVVEQEPQAHPMSLAHFLGEWEDITDTMGNVEAIHASGRAGLGLVGALITRGMSIFPRLRLIELERVGFATTAKERARELQVVTMLGDWLSAKLRVGSPVALRLCDCDLTEEMVEMLSHDVGGLEATLVWDRNQTD